MMNIHLADVFIELDGKCPECGVYIEVDGVEIETSVIPLSEYINSNKGICHSCATKYLIKNEAVLNPKNKIEVPDHIVYKIALAIMNELTVEEICKVTADKIFIDLGYTSVEHLKGLSVKYPAIEEIFLNN